MPSPSEIRAQARAARRNLTGEHERSLSLELAERLIESPFFQNNRHIGAYLSNDGEAGTERMIQEIWRQQKHCYLPILCEQPRRQLQFGEYTPQTPLTSNKYGIPEPPAEPGKLREPWRLDMVLVPLVAFDSSGNRLGMGGGYYDRTFAFRLAGKRPPTPILIGVAFECQRRERLPAQDWDVPLDAVVTEQALQIFSPPQPSDG